jgi:glycosyltransferase involved in cell wall biosynthesis
MQKSLPITPVILTFNEQPNIARTLDALLWADRVVILDSGSTDQTESIARSYRNVTWYTRAFDCHAAQWSHAVKETNVDTDWVLALDADMVVIPAFVVELEQHFFAKNYAGGIVPFKYCTGGRELLGSLYPPDLRVFQPHRIRIDQVGHSQRFSIEAETYRFSAHLFHDDRKPLRGWVKAQMDYALLEHRRMSTDHPSGLKYSLRRLGLLPVIAGIAGYVRAGGPLRGYAAVQYAYERLTFESLVALQLFRDRADGLDAGAGQAEFERNPVNR